VSEDRINSALENCVQTIDGLKIASPAGATQLVIDGDIHAIAHKLLIQLFKGSKASVKRARLSVIGMEAITSKIDDQIPFSKGKAS
jgi:hypothetical protein